MAKRLGISPKALRVYERAGLVRPHRTDVGWRAYGPAQQARLHQVLVLKRLGLSLKRIGELLEGKMKSLEAVLALQQQVLESRRLETDRALALLSAARCKLAANGALSPDDLAQLTRETAMTKSMTEEELGRTLQPFVDKHFTPAEQDAFRARKNDFDQARVVREWDDLIAEGRALQAKGDPTSPEASDLARRWMDQVRKFAGDDPDTIAKTARVNMDALADPETARKMPFDLSLMQFVSEAYRHADTP
jgi:DNA-binding transcriptional MerR regulator